ncbi:acyl-CoA dehydrogenase [Aestuariibacter sp. AA17]|uniref:Acyl-CoA dehydrogenase n=1 Tax=Fluctibacter corallii TaxID=2984329 RepID=A0ABT3A5J5_9ALTE|nr:acyl-CoA dehydrogenase [Aestuariibacter sp. AA17]MCV2883949.1 acyl-CoA dehydrogenase [Aestuariibacter sp. AA17]
MDLPLIKRKELDFQLYECLDTETLCQRARFFEHSRDTFNAVLDTAERIATDKFAPHNTLADKAEPEFNGQSVTMLDAVKSAVDAYNEAGFIAGRYDYEEGGMQLPETVMTACAGYFMAANPSTTAYPFLTVAAANVIRTFASDAVKSAFLPRMLEGTYTGTMALTEPHAGSSLADIKTRAVKQDDGTYRIKGSKLYISAGEHELSENIIHLVLAKIDGAPDGVKGISLFAVPKYRLDSNNELADKNDVALAGLIHKLGYRGTTSTALSFGDNDDCLGYLIGEENVGLKYMFQMMNEARLGVGFGAAMIGYRGYQYSLAYAKDRLQGRAAPNIAPSDPQVPIIEHGDVKRMLLAQKAYVEGAMALCFYGARLVDDIHTLEDKNARKESTELLDLLTPAIKAWPSEFGVKANDLAIQVLGGAGYTREYPVEQCWRDNRLNPIHEGTNGIQALDLLTRKLWQNRGMGLGLLQARIEADFAKVSSDDVKALVHAVSPYLAQFVSILPNAAKGLGDTRLPASLANASCMLNVFSTLLVSWMWIRQANTAANALTRATSEDDLHFYQGKLQAAKYFIRWELPLIKRDLNILTHFDSCCADMQQEWF